MMKNLKSLIFIIIFSFVQSSHAQVENETGADFLKFGIGGRASAMGESFCAVKGDVTSLYWNPAGLSELKKVALSGMHTEAVLNSSLEFLGAAFPVKSGYSVGVAAILFLNDPVPVTDSTGESIGNLTWYDLALSLTVSGPVFMDIDGGITSKLIYRQETDPIFGEASGYAPAFDIGLIYEIKEVEGLSCGISVLNLGNGIKIEEEKKTDDLPETYKAGLSYQRGPVLAVVDINKILDDAWRLSGGLEFVSSENIIGRAGYYKKAGNIEGVTYGVGFKSDKFSIDWANLPAGEIIGFTRENRISASISF